MSTWWSKYKPLENNNTSATAQQYKNKSKQQKHPKMIWIQASSCYLFLQQVSQFSQAACWAVLSIGMPWETQNKKH